MKLLLSRIEKLSVKQLLLLVLFFFLLFKLPMCFGPYNPEELRDFDHFLMVSDGEKAFKDFVWVYGPVTPLVYGNLLKFLPDQLLSVRFISLFIWAIAALFITLLLARYIKSRVGVLLAAMVCTGIVGYPSYCHNHVMTATAIIISTYYLILFVEKKRVGDLLISFGMVVLALYTRPLLMGYAIYFTWLGIFLINGGFSWGKRLKYMAGFVAFTLLVFGIFYAWYGQPMVNGFRPLSWALNDVKGYPNLSYLLPLKMLKNVPLSSFIIIKMIRVAGETALFYVHYFIWPASLFTLAHIYRDNAKIRAATFCLGAALVSSIDLLYYGFTYPDNELALTVRGQFFISLTLVSILLLLTPTLSLWRNHRWRWLGGTTAIALIGFWTYGTFMSAAYHMSKLHLNPFKVPILRGIFIDPNRSHLLLATQFINEICTPEDNVIGVGYIPGLRHFIKCNDPFDRDSFMFTRLPNYQFVPGENPYVPEGNIENREFLDRELAAINPRIMLLPPGYPHWVRSYCNGADWQVKRIVHSRQSYKVCWKKKAKG